VVAVIQELFSITKDRRFRRKEKGVHKGSSRMGKGEKEVQKRNVNDL
jgi:hypothetical protein